MSKKTKAVKAELPAKATGVRNAELALLPSINAAAVIEKYQGNVMGKDVDMAALIDGLRESFDKSRDGDLSRLEYMLIGQATALQSIFTSLARRAQAQEYQKNLESFLGLALKAQAQSRATIQAVVELKYPRQIAFVKQANISHGPQQVNNGGGNESNTRTHARTEENQTQQNKLLEDQSHERTHLDTGTTATASRSNKTLETVGAVNRAKKRTR
ncbi:MAG: hypothetical protein A3I66_12650 [Burkholderiales bacterium RIFCSPLOWO2_02_FULL_57_36]|nr:MAG: hypothetical protein A3I66_12650 [Burkholderiales bacterium RIFCSPLOWO2_02_FULL_57_36]